MFALPATGVVFGAFFFSSCTHSNPPRSLRGHGYRLSLPDGEEQGYRRVPLSQGRGGPSGRIGDSAAFDEGYRDDHQESSEMEGAPQLDDLAASSSPSADRVVAFLPVSGSFAAMGKAIERGLPCGLQGEGVATPPTVTVVDAAVDEPTASAALSEAVRQGRRPVGIVGPFISSQIPIVAQVSNEFSIPAFNLAKEVAAPGNRMTDLGFSLTAQLSALVRDGIQRSGIHRLAIARTPTPLSTKTADELRRMLEGSGVVVVFDGTYGEGGEFSGVRELVQRLEETAVDGLFVADTVQGAGRLLSSLGQSLRNRITVFGPGAWYNMTALRNAQDAFRGAVFPVPLIAREEQPLFQKLSRCLPPKRDRNGDFLAALGFDVGTIVALRSEGRLGLYKGLTGSFGLEENGVTRTVPVGVYAEGAIRPYSPIIRSLADVLPDSITGESPVGKPAETGADGAV